VAAQVPKAPSAKITEVSITKQTQTRNANLYNSPEKEDACQAAHQIMRTFGVFGLCQTCGLDPYTIPIARPAPPLHKCTNCGSSEDLLLDRDLGEYVCASCGQVVRLLVYEADMFPDQEAYKVSKSVGYFRRFYLNEVLKQWQCQEPPMPSPLFRILRRAYHSARRKDRRFWSRKRLDRDRIHALCRSISATSVVCELPGLEWTPIHPYTSRKFKAKRTGRPLPDFRKFGEKWRGLICRLAKRPAPRPPPALVNYISDFYQQAEVAFLQIRHAPDCDHRFDCHKTFRCRNSMLAVNYVCKKAILSYCEGDKQHPIYKRHKHDWPELSRERRHQIKRQYWLPLCRLAMGGFRFWVD
jgi:hypothetical protein